MFLRRKTTRRYKAFYQQLRAIANSKTVNCAVSSSYSEPTSTSYQRPRYAVRTTYFLYTVVCSMKLLNRFICSMLGHTSYNSFGQISMYCQYSCLTSELATHLFIYLLIIYNSWPITRYAIAHNSLPQVAELTDRLHSV